MGTYRFSVHIAATPAAVWRVYADPLRIPEWQTGRPVIDEVHGDPGEVGATYTSSRGRLVARTTVVSATPPTGLVTTTDAYLGMRLDIVSRLTERAGGTDLEFTATSHWPRGRRQLGRLVDLAILNQREARKELAALKALVEAGST